MLASFCEWFDRLRNRSCKPKARARRLRARPHLEFLENRLAPTTTPFSLGEYPIDLGQSIQTSAGATSLNLGAQTAGAGGTAIKPGDLLLITQVNDNSSGSGAVTPAGLFEYVLAQNTVAPTGGLLQLQGVGPGGGLLNSYSSGQGQDGFEIIDLDAHSAASTSTVPGVPSAAPSVLTQQLDYSPGQTALIEAAGFQTGEAVRFQVSNLTNEHVYGAWTATEGTGPIDTSWVVPPDAAQSQLVLTATGENSGLTARYTFRDAASENLDINPNFASISSTVTFSVLITNTSTDGSVMRSAKITLPAGYTAISVAGVTSSNGTWTSSVSGQTVSVTTAGAGLQQPGSGNNPNGDFLQVNVTATTPPAPTGANWLVTTYTDPNFTTVAVNPTTLGVNIEPVTILTAPITTTTQTTINVASSAGMTSNQLLVIGTEIVKIQSISGNTLTVQRAQSSTTAGTWPQGSTVRATGDSNQAPAGRQYVTSYITPGVTTLNGAIAATQTTINVASGAGISNGDILAINGEWVQVVSGGGTNTLTVNRGIDTTIASTHPTGTSISKVFAVSPNVTTLNGAITASQTTITVASGATISNGEFLVIDGEYMQVTAGGGTTSLTVTRGLLGTTGAAHTSGAPVSTATAPTVSPGSSQTYTMTLVNTDVGADNETLFNQTIVLPSSYTNVSLPVLTTLAAPITSATQTSITVTSAAGITTGETIAIDGEYMTVSAISGNTLTVSRGQSYNGGANNTIATTHASGAQVQQASFTAFTSTGAVKGTWIEAISGNYLHVYANSGVDLKPGEYVNYQFTATAGGSGALATNSAAWHTLVTRDSTQVFPLAGSQPFVFVSSGADLQITKTDGKTTAVPGTSNTYTIVVTNAGPDSVTGATVMDTFPANFTGVTWTASAAGGATGFTVSGSGNINDTVTMPVGSTITYLATGTIDPTATGSLSNTATVTPPAGVTDPNPGNNSATDTDTLTPQADLSILKTDGSSTAVPGTNVAYTITVTNNGPSTVTGATVSDPLPAGTTFVSATGGATYDPGTNTVNYTTGTVAPGGTSSFTLTLAIAPTLTGSLANTASVTPPAGVTDPIPGNNSSTDTDTLTPQADLQITKTDNQTVAMPGTTDTYVIVVTNAGPSSVTGATVMDTFPATFTGVTWTATSTGGATGFTANGSGNINDTVTMPPGSTITYLATGTISPTASGTLSNTATVTPPAGVTDPNPGNNSATDTTSLTPEADLSILKTDGSSTAVPGSNVTYTITVTNNGPNPVTGATVSDMLPAGTTFVSATGGATFNSGTNTVNFTTGTLGNGGTTSFMLTLAISPTLTGTLSNTATVAPPAGVTDPNPGNNSSTDTDTLTPQADLQITKTDNKISAVPGTSNTYTIVVTNAGPSSVTGATVMDTFPANFTNVTWTATATGGATGFTANGSGNIINDTVTMPVGSTITYLATGTISAGATGSLSNTATVATPPGVTDPNPGNNSSTDTDTLTPQADLQITKTDNTTTAVPGTTDTYTIVVTNAGPSSVTGATVMDTFPANFTGVTWTATATGGATGFTANGSGNINDTVTMPVGSTITYLATGTISPSATGSLSNTATVTPPAGVTDPNPNNNSSTDTDTLTPQNDVSVTKTDNDGGSARAPRSGTTVPGTTIIYTITVSNSGPSTATNVSVSDPVSSSLTSFVWSGNGHTNVSGAIIDTIASLAPGASVVYTVTATVNPSATGTLSNTVTVSAANDTNPNNNTATDTDVLTPQNDVSVTKTDNHGGSSSPPTTGTVVPGNSITYTITVSNSGPSTATNVSVSDPVSSGLTSFVWSGNGHTNVSGAINDTIASLAPGSTVVYTVTATVDPSATGTLSNNVTVSAADDTNPANNTATVTDNLTPHNDVSVTKTDNRGGSSITGSIGAVVPGTSFTYTITVSNSGPSTATNVLVNDPFPAGITSAIWTGSNGSSGTGTLTDTIASLAPGAAVVYTVTATVDPAATAQLVNTVTVTAANDTNTANNTATNRDNLTPQNDVGVTKVDDRGGSSITGSNGLVVAGTSFTYTITVTNSGLSTATNVGVSDPVPSGLTSFVWSGNGHTNVSGAISDSIASLAPGASVVYTVTATVDPSDTSPITNTVTVTAANDTNPTNNSATVTDNVQVQPHVTVTKVDSQGGSSIAGSTGTVVPGNSFTYTITVSNSGPSTATNVSVSDPVPTGLTSFVWSGNGQTNVSGPISDTIATLGPGATVVYTVMVTASPSATGQITNTVTVTENGVQSVASDTDILTPQNDVSVIKTDNRGGSSSTPSTGTVVPGTSFIYTITVSNSGPSTATNVSVSDPVPSGLTSFVWSGNGHSNVSGALSDTIASLAPGATVVYTVAVTASPSAVGTLSNTATVSAANDTNPNNNSATNTDNLTPQNDVRVTKTDNKGGSSITGSNGTVVPGTSFTYTITVSNSGPSTATNVSVSDPVPSNLTSFVWSGNGHTNMSGSINDTIASLAPGATVVYTVTATVDPAAVGQITNSVTVSAANDTNPNNNTASVTDNLTPQADLAIFKTDGDTTAVPGTNVTYAITVTNNGPSTVTGATVSDVLPAGTTFVSATNGATFNPVTNTVNFTTGTLATNGTTSFQLTLAISPTLTGTLSNAATVTPPAGVTDPNPANNSSTDTDTLTPQADLQITKTDGKTTAVPGTSNTYTIVVTNAGPSSVTGARVTDTFPANFTGVTYTATATGGATGFTANGSGNINDTVTMPVGSTITYLATGTITPTATGSLSNTATVTAPAGVTDTNPSNNSATDTDALTPQTDLSILKTDSKTSVVPGTNNTYTITVTNHGPSTVTGATVSDVLPAGTTFVSAPGGTFNSSTNTVSFTTGTLANGGSASFTVTLAISPSLTGTLANSATVTPPAGVTDPNPGNNSSTDTDTLTPQADLRITKTDNKTTAVPGTSNTYTIVVTNAGPSSVPGATVMDTFPANFTNVTYTATATGGATGFTSSGNGNINDTVTMPPGSTITYLATGTISPSAIGSLSNTATVTPPAGVTDTNPSNNSATDTDTLTSQADLQITKTDGKTTAVPGTTNTYTIVVTNAGPSSVTGARVMDTFPANFTNVTFTTSATGGATGFTSSGSGNINDTVTMPPGSTITYLATGTISPSATGSLSNTATVTPPTGVTDPNTSNNSSTDTDTLTPQADLQVTKTTGSGNAVPGTNVTYTITVANNGPSTVTGARVSDVLPAGTTFVSATGGATYSSITNTVSYTTGTLANGGTASFLLTLAVSPTLTGNLSNTATVTPPAGVTDPNSGNNSSTATSTLTPQADLSILKTTGSGNALPGSNITYTVTITNHGPSTMTGAQVSDVLPANTTFVSATNGATYDPGSNTLTFITGTLANGGTTSFMLTLALSPSATGSLSNTATVTPPVGVTDPNPSNNSSTVTTIIPPPADLSILKTDTGGGTAIPGSNVTYNITVTNNGPNSVTGATVSDVLPAGTTFVSAPGGTFNSSTNTVSFTTGTLANGGTTSFLLTLAISPTLTGSLSNTATVTPPANVFDPDTSNNSSTDPITLTPQADLSIVKTTGQSSVLPGGNVTYTITVGNHGPSSVTGALVSDVLPAGTAFVSATNGATFDSGSNTVSFTTGTLGNGGSTSFQLTLAISPTFTGSLSNTATVTPPAGVPDPNLANNSSTATSTLAVSSLTGFVYLDQNNNGVKDPGETGIPNTTVTLTGTDVLGNPVNVSTLTDGNGQYTFSNLLPSGPNTPYTITETQPAGYLNGKLVTPTGTFSGTMGPGSNAGTRIQFSDVYSGIAIGPGSMLTGSNFNFGEGLLSNVVPPAQTTREGTVILFCNGTLTEISINTPDPNQPMQVTVSVPPDSGTLTMASTMGLTFTAGANGTSMMTFQGTANAVNTGLSHLTFMPTTYFSGPADLTLTSQALDSSGNPVPGMSVTSTVPITVTPVNHPPTIQAPGTQTTPASVPLVFSTGNGNGITLGDPDVDPNVQVEQLTLTGLNGTVMLGNTAGLVSVSGNGTSSVTLMGTINALNAAVNGLIFTPTSSAPSTAYLMLSLNDLGNTVGPPMQTGRTIAISVT